MPSLLSILCVGLALGASSAWFALRHSSSARTANPAPPPPVTLAAWSWRDAPTPALLARDSAASAISAWLSQGSLDFRTRASGLRALLVRLPAESFPRLVDLLSRSAADDDRRLLSLAFAAWTELDTPAAARWAGQAGDAHHGLARQTLARWLDADPRAAAEWACSLRDEKLALSLVGQALPRLAEKDPERALALARSRDTEFRDAALRAIFNTLGKTDPAGTLRRFAPELWRNGAGFWQLRELVRGWAKQDPAAALAWLTSQPGDAEDQQTPHWISQLAGRTGPERRALADAVLTAPGLSNRAYLLRDLFSGWAQDQPTEALAWLNAHPDPDFRLNLLERANNSFPTDHPQKALPVALALPEGVNRAERLSVLLGAWAKIDSEATLAWLRQHNAEPGVASASHAVHASLLADLAREDPKAALADYATLTAPAARAAAVEPIARAWGSKDPAAAFQWAMTATDTPYDAFSAKGELLARWSKNDPDAALRYVEDWHARESENRRAMIGSYLFDSLAGTWEQKAPRAATADLYSKIKDPALRADVLSRHVREWLTKDPAAARSWLESSSALTPAQAAALLAPPSR